MCRYRLYAMAQPPGREGAEESLAATGQGKEPNQANCPDREGEIPDRASALDGVPS